MAARASLTMEMGERCDGKPRGCGPARRLLLGAERAFTASDPKKASEPSRQATSCSLTSASQSMAAPAWRVGDRRVGSKPEVRRKAGKSLPHQYPGNRIRTSIQRSSTVSAADRARYKIAA